MKITFLGATGTVTGSKYLVEAAGKRILVDCGLYQGLKELRLRNWSPLPVDPKSIDMVVITHAHIDHTGYLPLLVKNGFRGPIYSTEATFDLCSILLPDSGHIQEEDARRANKYGYSKHKPALPLYTEQDAEIALNQFKIIHYEEPFLLNSQDKIIWHRAGHILGSSFIQFEINGIKTLFTGDMGRLNDSIMKPPTNIYELDYLIIESTYGNRAHDKTHPKEMLANIINETAKRGGSVLVPAFAVGRAQSLLSYLYELKQEQRIPDLPVYLDSPMAINATELLCKYADEHKLGREQCHLACNVATYTRSVEESKMIDQQRIPRIIISASGMATGGRILHHLNMLAFDHRNTILFTGFQASGTRGARLINGEKEIGLFGQKVKVNARVAQLSNTSAHADYEEMILWLQQFHKRPKKVFITHGEPSASASLKEQIEKKLGWKCKLPAYLDKVELV